LAGTTTPTAIKYLRALMAKELIEKVPPNEIKPQHQNYTTVFLRLAPKAVDALTYLKKRIKQAAEDRKGRKYNKDAHSHLRSIS
jgi:hypothetical protein